MRYNETTNYDIRLYRKRVAMRNDLASVRAMTARPEDPGEYRSLQELLAYLEARSPDALALALADEHDTSVAGRKALSRARATLRAAYHEFMQSEE
jgi:hypothetical protein